MWDTVCTPLIWSEACYINDFFFSLNKSWTANQKLQEAKIQTTTCYFIIHTFTQLDTAIKFVPRSTLSVSLALYWVNNSIKRNFPGCSKFTKHFLITKIIYFPWTENLVWFDLKRSAFDQWSFIHECTAIIGQIFPPNLVRVSEFTSQNTEYRNNKK